MKVENNKTLFDISSHTESGTEFCGQPRVRFSFFKERQRVCELTIEIITVNKASLPSELLHQ